MPTQRSFFSNFLLAFRAHSQPIAKTQPSRPSPTSGGVASSTQTLWTSSAAPNPANAKVASSENITSSAPRPITNKPKANAATASALSTSPDLRPALQHNVSPQTHLPRSASSSPGTPPVYGPPNKPAPSYPTAAEAGRQRQRRRGSDDSNSSDGGGFREVRSGAAGEKWFVGGRTAAGEEKYFQLRMVKRERSADRVSADQLSL